MKIIAENKRTKEEWNRSKDKKRDYKKSENLDVKFKPSKKEKDNWKKNIASYLN